MNVKQLKDYCRTFQGVIPRDSGYPSNVLYYSVSGKKFAYFKTSEPEKWRFSIRVSSDRFLELTDQPGIKPARYMHRFHWITIVNVQSVDEGDFKELIEWSYAKAFSSLSKKAQSEIFQNALT